MSPLTLFLTLGGPAFFIGAAIGYGARPIIDRILSEGRMNEQPRSRRRRVRAFLDQPPQRVIVIVLAIVALVACAALVYTVQVGQKTNETKTQGNDLIDCLSALIKESSAVSEARSAATQKRDDAKRVVIRATVKLATDTTPSDQERHAALQALDRYLKVSAELDKVRVSRPIPSFREYCESTKRPHPSSSKAPPRGHETTKPDDKTTPGASGAKQKTEKKGRRAPAKKPTTAPTRSPQPRPPSMTPTPTQPLGGLLLPDIWIVSLLLPGILAP